MTDVRVEPNQRLIPELSRAFADALDDRGESLASAIRANASGLSSHVAAAIGKVGPRITTQGIEVDIEMAKSGFVGRFMEQGTKPRFRETWRGEPLNEYAFTGSMPATPFVEPAAEQVLSPPLEIKL